MSGVHEEEKKGIAYYRRVVRYTPKQARLFLIIGACDYSCEVTVNGKKLTSHLGGYAPVEVEVTEVWNKLGDNEIIVRAEDNDDHSFQTYGKQGYGNIRGIWQTVYLEERPSSYIEYFVFRTEISGRVTFDFEIKGEYDAVECEFGGVVCKGRGNHLELTIPEPELWTPEEPNLYEGCLRLVNREETDEIHTYFGIREVGTAKYENGCRYVTLNGKPVYVNSTLDQSFNPWGFFTLPSDEETENEILRMKKLGLNSARIHIKTEEPLKLYYADKHGLMIIQDIPCFWGEPGEKARKLFDEQMIECVRRDINHPSIVHWVIYNETWGLFTDVDGKKTYTKDTQEWVRKNYRFVKDMDPTRIVEDNSVCNYDHVETDINTWHFYANGYEVVKKVISDFTEANVIGSSANYTVGNVMEDVPLMNSECGNVWGIDGSAGDSDMSWHYHYMINQFRLEEKLCGFVFTEFHDVVNEFNGYYRIDNTEKMFGFEEYVPGMSMVDLHTQDFLAYDAVPMRTVKGGETVKIPLYISSFTDKYHDKDMKIRAELWYTDDSGTCHFFDVKEIGIKYNRYGLIDTGEAELRMPQEEAVAVARLYLETADGETVMRNFTTFDVRDEIEGIEIPLDSADVEGHGKFCQEGAKLNLFNGASAKFDIPLEGLDLSNGVEILFEASARETFTRDRIGDDENELKVGSYMLGYRVDPGENPNCFFMTDEKLYPSTMTVKINEKSMKVLLPDSPADSRGCLSWHYQAQDRRLDDAGTYGYMVSIVLDGEDIKSNKLSLEISSDRGISLFGRNSGRYPTGLRVAGR
jgi:hypothetical protein